MFVTDPHTTSCSCSQRYDVVSTGMGALAVTGYCFYRGQDFGTAMSITFMSTIAALVSDCW